MAGTQADLVQAIADSPFAPTPHARYAAWLQAAGDQEGARWQRAISRCLSEEGKGPGKVRLPAAWEARLVLAEPVAAWCDALKAYVARNSGLEADVTLPTPVHTLPGEEKGSYTGYDIYPDGSLWHHHPAQGAVWADGWDFAEHRLAEASRRPWEALPALERTLLVLYFGEAVREKFPPTTTTTG